MDLSQELSDILYGEGFFLFIFLVERYIFDLTCSALSEIFYVLS